MRGSVLNVPVQCRIRHPPQQSKVLHDRGKIHAPTPYRFQFFVPVRERLNFPQAAGAEV